MPNIDISVSLVIALVTALVGLLCLGLLVAALLRLGKVRAGHPVPGETQADLRIFARNQGLSALVMFALAAFILLYS